MLVSNFELLLKRIATVNAPPSITAVFRRVVQGYFLEVSNLEESLRVRMFPRLTISVSSGNRIIQAGPPPNVQAIFDNGNTQNLSLNVSPINQGNPNVLQYNIGAFVLEPQQTGLIAILPNLNAFINDANPDLEIRGYVELLRARFFIFGSVPPAQILISPETRGTFLDNDYPTTNTANELDFDQLAYSIPTASGRGQNTIEGLPPIVFDGVLDQVDQLSTATLRSSLQNSNPDIADEELTNLVNMFEFARDNDDLIKVVKKLRKDA